MSVLTTKKNLPVELFMHSKNLNEFTLCCHFFLISQNKFKEKGCFFKLAIFCVYIKIIRAFKLQDESESNSKQFLSQFFFFSLFSLPPSTFLSLCSFCIKIRQKSFPYWRGKIQKQLLSFFDKNHSYFWCIMNSKIYYTFSESSWMQYTVHYGHSIYWI